MTPLIIFTLLLAISPGENRWDYTTVDAFATQSECENVALLINLQYPKYMSALCTPYCTGTEEQCEEAVLEYFKEEE